ncbi:hypothetical protein BU23DRAFT_552457 [Bimuria novae-zelandiae CBS 107.79]|uniref:Uncharacterized protein n=1 Tax=Bimuria novae-zelandiae CBS 107.79 TaxID=1447943 RepID=A0A6A5VEB9_9PLEO|nr:hypothetical protein BU23DRAFT_552457 [Bimuria novae-zelandiae CBS 107.79]
MPPKKFYRGPQADEATFATQQDFLDSLTPIPLELVAENDRKCSYCWRLYGECNPDQDDAEAPVQFRCHHVYGEQCMRTLFALRQPVRVDLVPLSFAPGSRGADLGSRLSSYVDTQGIDRSALLTGGNREKDFARLLWEATPSAKMSSSTHARGIKLLGTDWYGIYFEILCQAGSQPKKIHIVENAVVIDSDNTTQENLNLFGDYGQDFMPHHPGWGPLPTDIDNPFAQGTPAGYVQGPFANQLAPANSLNVTDSPTNYLFPQPFGLAPKSNLTSQLASTASFSSTVLDPVIWDDFVPTTWEQEAQKIKEKEKQKPSNSGSWQDVLSSQSKLDGLVAKHKEKQAEEAEAKKQIEAEAKVKVLKTPGGLPQLVNNPQQFVQTAFYKKLPELVQTVHPNAAVSHQKPLAKETELLDYADASSALQAKQQAELKAQIQAEQQAKKLAQKNAKKRAAKEKEAEENRKKNLIDRLANAFAEVYDAYERYNYDAAITAGRPPPVKKLRLASQKTPSTTPSTTPPTPTSAPKEVQLVRPEVVHLVATVHAKSADAKGIEVAQPYISDYMDVGGTDDDEDEEDDIVDAERVVAAFEGKTIFLKRKACNLKGCCVKPPLVPFHSVPEYVFWKDDKKIPDGCPKCFRVLFKKN